MAITFADIRLTDGVTITPPPSVITDSYFPYVPLLLNTTSSNAQPNNSFLDSSASPLTITRNGTPTQGSSSPYSPIGWSMNCTGGNYVSTSAASANLRLDQGNWTIEFWIYITAWNTNNRCFDTGANGDAAAFVIGYSNAGALNWGRPTAGTGVGTSSGVLTLNRWYHIACTSEGAGLNGRIYVDGVLKAGPSNYTNTTGTSVIFNLGRNNVAAGDWTGLQGYMSNFRFVSGQRLYTSDFTPQVTPLNKSTYSTNGGSTFSSITGTSQLLTLQNNRFIDNSVNAFSLVGTSTPKIQAFQPFPPTASYTTSAYGGSSYFGTANTDYLTSTSSSALAFGTGAYTVEFWIYMASYTGGNNRVIDLGNATNSFGVQINNTGTVSVTQFGAVDVITSSVGFVLGQWNHVAVVRTSTGTNGTAFYLNGTSLGTGTDATNWTVVTTPRINGLTGYSLGWVGYLSNLRVVKGTAVYTGVFTPPTLAPLTTSGSTSAASYPSTTNVDTTFAAANTSLLFNFTNAGIYDAAMQNNPITVGSTQSSITQYQWSPTSMKFNGTTDYLDLGSNTAFVMGSGNWTVESWVYPTSTSAGHWIYLQGNAFGYGAIRVGCQSNQVFLLISTNGTTNTVTSGLVGSVPLNTWTYLAVTRSGATVTLYVNGTSVYTSTALSTSSLMTGTYNLVGRIDPTNLQYFAGYIQDLRITKGIARTITTPTSAFPTQ